MQTGWSGLVALRRGSKNEGATADETGRELTTGNTRTKYAAMAHTLLKLHTLHAFPVCGNRNVLISSQKRRS